MSIPQHCCGVSPRCSLLGWSLKCLLRGTSPQGTKGSPWVLCGFLCAAARVILYLAVMRAFVSATSLAPQVFFCHEMMTAPLRGVLGGVAAHPFHCCLPSAPEIRTVLVALGGPRSQTGDLWFAGWHLIPEPHQPGRSVGQFFSVVCCRKYWLWRNSVELWLSL